MHHFFLPVWQLFIIKQPDHYTRCAAGMNQAVAMFLRLLFYAVAQLPWQVLRVQIQAPSLLCVATKEIQDWVAAGGISTDCFDWTCSAKVCCKGFLWVLIPRRWSSRTRGRGTMDSKTGRRTTCRMVWSACKLAKCLGASNSVVAENCEDWTRSSILHGGSLVSFWRTLSWQIFLLTFNSCQCWWNFSWQTKAFHQLNFRLRKQKAMSITTTLCGRMNIPSGTACLLGWENENRSRHAHISMSFVQPACFGTLSFSWSMCPSRTCF